MRMKWMKRMNLWVCVACTVLLMLLASDGRGQGTGTGCGLVPLKPLVPLGCKDLTPVCQCDAKGKNCRWGWVCVR